MEEVEVEYLNVGDINGLHLRNKTILAKKNLMLMELWKKMIFLYIGKNIIKCF